ncbi:MAG: DUF3810 domain-containing protein, partial [Corallococcus sp.]|nr:DUF3810 domain-containing protein [Corallococcus sp.]
MSIGERKSLIRKIIANVVLLLTFVALLLFKNSVAVCEWFATHISRWWIAIFGAVFGIFPISFYEVFLICLIIFAVYLLIKLIICLCKKAFKRVLSGVLSVALVLFSFLTLYTAIAGMSYNRAQLDINVYNKSNETNGRAFEKSDAVELAQNLISQLNALYEKLPKDEKDCVCCPYSSMELQHVLSNEYNRLNSNYFSPYTPRYKTIINKTIMSELHITGVFFAPTGEANINGNVKGYDLPFTALHELAHSKGVMRESDANQVARYLSLT